MKQLFTLSYCLLLSFSVFAQNESTKWYFGNHAALDFMTNPPTVMNNSCMWMGRGCASIADSAGNLLFYTNGVQVWNKQHNVMANGNLVFPGGYITTPPLIIKQPGSSHVYFIITAVPPPHVVPLPVPAPVIAHGLFYSIVDMSLAAGMGSVVVNNVQFFTTQFYVSNTSHIHATKHANGIDYWILTHRFVSTNTFQAFKLTSSGINPVPVLSNAGMLIQGGGDAYLKFSPNGQKICMSTSQTGLELFDFNTNTGQVSNPLTLVSDFWEYNYRGCEFSPDGTKVYFAHNMTGSTNSNLIQVDLSAGTNSAIAASSLNIPGSAINPEALQLAPNGKIYISSNGSSSLSVIDNPNAAGIACNFIMNGQAISAAINPTLNSFATIGLPNNITYTVPSACISPTVNNPQTICQGNFFSIANHSYSIANQYVDTVQNIFACNGRVIVKTQLSVNPLPNLGIQSNSVICRYTPLSLNANGASTYTWNQQSTGNQFVTPPFGSTGAFVFGVELKGKSSLGCVNTNTFQISVMIQVCDVGLSEGNTGSDKWSIYPNPAQEFILIDCDSQTELKSMQITDVSGQVVAYEDLNSINEGKPIELHLVNGVYFVTITAANGASQTKKIVVAR